MAAVVTEALAQLDRVYYEMDGLYRRLDTVAEHFHGCNPDLAHQLHARGVCCELHADLVTDGKLTDLLLEASRLSRWRPETGSPAVSMCDLDLLPWVYDDGGAGAGPDTQDCVARAIAIASGRPYCEVFGLVDQFCHAAGAWAVAGDGVPYELTDLLMSEIGWRRVPLRNASLVAGSLPVEPRLIADLPEHVCAVIDGVVHDTFDPTAWRNDDGLPIRVLAVYLPPRRVVVEKDPSENDAWNRLQLAAETGALSALIRESVSDPNGDECYCDYCLVGDSWK